MHVKILGKVIDYSPEKMEVHLSGVGKSGSHCQSVINVWITVQESAS